MSPFPPATRPEREQFYFAETGHYHFAATGSRKGLPISLLRGYSYIREEDGIMAPAIRLDRDRVAQFCRKWKIAKLALLGRLVGLVSWLAVERSRNQNRCEAIFSRAEPIYGARSA